MRHKVMADVHGYNVVREIIIPRTIGARIGLLTNFNEARHVD